MTRRERIEARAALLTEPARSRVREAIDALKDGRIKPDQVADLVRDRRGLQTIAIEIAVLVSELRMGGAVAIEGPNAHGAPGGRSMWWGWIAQVYPDETVTSLSLAERPNDAGFDMQWRPASEDARHSDDMKSAVSLLRRELGEWLGRPVRLFEVWT